MIALFTAKQFFRYTIMPEFLPRLNGLMTGGFGNVAYLIAVVYNMVRLIPNNHAYLNPRNIGRFGIRHVIAEAANNLVISRNNIDQILLFVIVLVGMIMLALQILMLGAYVFIQSAGAAPPAWANDWNDFFRVANPEQDIAYIMLDLVFGVPHPTNWPGSGFFESCVGRPMPCLDSYGLPIQDVDFSTVTVAGMPVAATIGPLSTGSFAVFPFPIHLGMQALFGMYNLGLLIIAAIITAYFIATVIAETAQSGTPFGKRFNKLWAPIRIVVAIGLLMPLVTAGGIVGMNSAQYIVLYAAKYGSAFATNGWNRFSNTLAANYLIESRQAAISRPTMPEIEHISLFMWLVNVCYYVNQYQSATPATIIPYVIGRQNRTPINTLVVTGATSLDDALAFLDPGPKAITIRFGEKDNDPENDADGRSYSKEDGNVKPICGEIQIPLTDPRRMTSVPPVSLGVNLMQTFYFNLIRDMWYEFAGTSPYQLAELVVGGDLRAPAFAYHAINNRYNAPYTDPLTNTYISAVNNVITTGLRATIDAAVILQENDPSFLGGPCSNGPGSTLQNKGWGAAGVWYNCIAELNGSMTTSVTATPNPTLMPQAMEGIAAIKSQYDKNNTGPDKYQPVASGTGDTAAMQKFSADVEAAAILYEAHRAWIAGQSTTQTVPSNPFSAAVSTFLGTNGLYDMRRNVDTHPLAQLVGIGRALVEAAVRKIGYAMAGAAVSRALNGADGGLVGVASSMLVTIAMLGLTAGFVLYYIVPFLPFIYFFFALGGWVKAVFEAMVAAPLWALAHIRIDGHGLPGNAAMNGYFLIFEIFVRPILTVFGLLASVSILAGLVAALNGIFDLVVSNTSGFNMDQELVGPAADSLIASMRGTIDEFFYTVMYAIIVYMMAMSSFKLIDQIPNNILRWMGQSVPTFGDTREDPAAGLMGRASMGAQQAFGRLGSGLSGMVGAVAKK